MGLVRVLAKCEVKSWMVFLSPGHGACHRIGMEWFWLQGVRDMTTPPKNAQLLANWVELLRVRDNILPKTRVSGKEQVIPMTRPRRRI